MNVGRILEGSVRKSGNRLRIAVQLIDALSDMHIWAESYDREVKDIFDIQSDIAQRVAESMQARLLESDRHDIERGVTRNPEAHNAYLRGLYLINRGTKEGVLKSSEYFEQAVAIDPRFALAYSALSDCCTYLAGQYMPAKEYFPRAKEYAEKAIKLDEELAEGHASVGIVSMQYDWDWEKARTNFARAIELNPNYSIVHLWYGAYLLMVRCFDEALIEFYKAEELNPLSPLVRMNIGVVLYNTKRYDEAISKLREAKEMEEGLDTAYWISALAYAAKSMFDEAISELESGLVVGETSDLLGTLGYVYGVSGKREEALKILTRLERLGEKSLNCLTNAALIHIGLHENEHALDLLERALADKEEWFPMSCQTPVFDPIRSNIRFKELMRKMSLPA